MQLAQIVDTEVCRTDVVKGLCETFAFAVAGAYGVSRIALGANHKMPKLYRGKFKAERLHSRMLLAVHRIVAELACMLQLLASKTALAAA